MTGAHLPTNLDGAREQPKVVPTPTSTLDALKGIHDSMWGAHEHLRVLLRVAALDRQNPEMRTVAINQANNGVYQVVDEASWPAKSIGILNVGNAPVFLGVGGVSARPGSRAPSCPGASALVLPVEVQDLELGCDPAVLGANTAVVYLFRYVTVQPLTLGYA